jgi:hypothetical protein
MISHQDIWLDAKGEVEKREKWDDERPLSSTCISYIYLFWSSRPGTRDERRRGGKDGCM